MNSTDIQLNGMKETKIMTNGKVNFQDSQKYAIEELFGCLICVDVLDNAKVLECGHMFCHRCLTNFFKTYSGVQYEQLGASVPCPTCRKLTKITPDGLPEVKAENCSKKAQLIGRKLSIIGEGPVQKCDPCIFKKKVEESEYYCHKCSLNFCSKCRQTHQEHSLFKSHQVIHISNKETIMLFCNEHNKMESFYFCLDCKIPNCTICVLQEHSTHNTTKLHDALFKKRDSIKTLLNNLGPKLDRLEAKMKKLTHFHEMYSKNRNSTSSLPKESDNLYPHSHRVSVSDAEIVDSSSIQKYYFHIDQIRRVFDLSTKMLEVSQSKRLLAVYNDITLRIQAMIDVEAPFLQKQIDPLYENELGQILYLQPSPTGSSCSMTFSERLASLSSTDDSSSNGDSCIFDPPQQSLLIKPKLIWKSERGKHDPGELLNPCGIAILPDSSIVVAEYDIINEKNNRLHIYDKGGNTVNVIGQGQIRPLGVCVTHEGNIAVTDCKAKRVKIFTPAGDVIADWGKGQFGWPYGIAVNSKDQFLVSDAFNDTISIHQHDGKRIKQFGSSGSGPNQFKNPYHIAVDSNDNIYVSDCGNNCIKVFDSNGKFLYKTTETSKHYFDCDIERKRKKRKLHAPRGLCIDMRGNILVADDCSRVCLFDSSGQYVRNVLTDEDSVKYAESVAVSSHGLLAVTEWNANNMFAVKVFTLYE